MKIMINKLAASAVVLGAAGLLFAGTADAATVDVYLSAKRFVKSINGENVPMWGYRDNGGPFASTACNNTNFPPAEFTAPGPEIVASAGDTLNIHLVSCIPNIDNEVADRRTSVIIPGQSMPVVDDPNPGGGTGLTGPRFYPAGNPNFAGRMRSQVPETRRRGNNRPQAVTYTFANLREGTYIYHSGTHMQVQVQMGLHGALTVCPGAYNATQGRCVTPNRPYAGARTGYFREASLFYSEIDPDIHRSVDRSCYGPDEDATRCRPANQNLRMTSTIGYSPKYLLINGEPFDGQKLDLQTAIPLNGSARRVLLRVRSAANRYHMIACKFCAGARAIAEDGYLYTLRPPGGAETVYEQLQETFLVSPLQTRDIYLVNVDPDNGGPLTRQLTLDLDRFGVIPPVAAAIP